MICKNCGTELPESSKFCTKCGTPTSDEEMNISAAGVERAVPKGFSAKKNIIIIIIAAILLIGGGITAIAVVNSHSASSGVSDRMQLAERYLNEQNYEQAIIEYQKVLEIEPMNVDAYLGIADAYLGMGDTDKALEWLNKGYERTGDARIQAKIDTLANSVDADTSELETPVTSVSEQPGTTVPETPVFGSMGSVTILGEEYDIATTTELFLASRGITDEQLKEIADEFAKLTNLTCLRLDDNQISDIMPLANLTYLTGLNLSDNQISNITPLTKFTNLTELYFDGNKISDITPLANLTNLMNLSLGDNQISDITSLAKLNNLTFLDLYENQISDVAPLAKLTNLEVLGLADIQISDIAPLEKLIKLTRLNLNYNQISDIKPLANLNNLTWLGLAHNDLISDITPLAKLTNLTELHLYYNHQISDEDIEKLRLHLPNCNIIG